MRTHLVLSAMAALAMGGEALADNVSYSYAQANVLLSSLSSHGSAMNGTGLGLEAGAGLGPYLFAYGSLNSNLYSAKLYDISSNSHLKIRLTPTTLGAGGHYSLFPSLDLLAGVSLERIKMKFAETGQPVDRRTFNGKGAMLGMRGWFSDVIQWDITARYSDVGDLGTILGYTFNARYYFKSAYSFGVDVNGRLYDDKKNNILNVNEATVAILFRHDFGVHF